MNRLQPEVLVSYRWLMNCST